MDFKQELQQRYSQARNTKLVHDIGPDPVKFAALAAHFFGPELRLRQQAITVMSCCADKYPFLVKPYLEKIILNLKQQPSGAVKRGTLRILQHQDIPRALQGLVADMCFGYLSGQAPPAIKVYSLSVIANLARSEPDLNQELKLVIEDQMPYASPAFKSRAGKILQGMKKSPVKTR
jgi:hypothetical protein